MAGDDADRSRRQLELVNELLVTLRQRLRTDRAGVTADDAADIVDLVAPPLRVLRAVQRDRQFTAFATSASTGSATNVGAHRAAWED